MKNGLIRASRRAVAAFALTAAALLAPAAQAQDGLKYFKNYFVTGDYVVSGVALRGTGVNGLASGDISIAPGAIPAGAEIIAAHLYWQTIGPSGGPDTAVLAGAKFKNNDITGAAVLVNPAGTSPCWSNGGAVGSAGGSRAIYAYRADVLRFFPRRQVGTGSSQRIDVEIAGNHQVSLPDAGNSNQLPSSLGAGLIVVYRVPGYAAGSGVPNRPLRSIVIFDGGYTMDQTTRQLSLTLEGFYEASRSTPNARMSQLVGNGQANFSERVTVQGTTTGPASVVAVNPFTGSGNGAGFDAVTFNNLPLEPGAMKAKVTVDAGGDGSFDCLTWGAVVLSTEVQDQDHDGLLDVWESQAQWEAKPDSLQNMYGAWPLATPGNGGALPNLQAMGASPTVQDIFVEVDYMTGTGHTHLPAKAALDGVAQAFRGAAPRPALVSAGLCSATAARGQCPINVHFDVGGNYQPASSVTLASCASAATWTPDCAIIRSSAGITGGDAIIEQSCAGADYCAFPDFPGTVGWKNGLRAHRDRLVKTGTRQECTRDDTAGCEPRFPRNRKDIFHYALFAHALALESTTTPGQPRRTSGIADNMGGDLMVTLGLWDNQVGTEFVQGATLMHELGHNLGLRHGGIGSDRSVIEANCKPNYQSVMNYLFQVRGLLNTQGIPMLDFSSQQLGALDESSLLESTGMGTTSYLARWYAPRTSSFIDRTLNTSPATRLCDGTPVTNGTDYVRVDADPRVRRTTTPAAIDWNADGTIAGTQAQDVNFDGQVEALGAGSNDFAVMDLRQVGGRRPIGSKSLTESVLVAGSGVGGGLSLDAGYGDLGYGDLGYGDLGYGDLGYGDLGYGDLGYGDLGYGDLGYGDLGYGDLGYGDLGYGDLGTEGEGDLDLDTAGSLGNAPHSLKGTPLLKAAELAWSAPHVGTATRYQVYRVTGDSVTTTNFATRLLVADLTANFTSLVDIGLKNNVTYTYFVVATLANPAAPDKPVQSGPSNFVSVKP